MGGGLLCVWLARQFLAARFPGLRAAWSVDRLVAFIPGALVGGLVGWLIIRQVNVALSWFFGIFNRAFDRLTAQRVVRFKDQPERSTSFIIQCGELMDTINSVKPAQPLITQ